MTLKLWHNDHDFFIAETAAEAQVLYDAWMHTTGNPKDDGEWSAWPDNEPFTLDDDGKKTTKTAAEWCAERESGYFASEDF